MNPPHDAEFLTLQEIVAAARAKESLNRYPVH